MGPKISIIVCTYNSPEMVRNVLDSINSQTYRNFEVLCVDGMSKDNTREIVKNYCRKDSRFRFLLNKNRLPEGKGNGKWLGFREAKGEIVGIIDQDNVLQDNSFLEKTVKTLAAEKDAIGVLGGLKNDKRDDLIVRYVSLFGTDPFFAYRSVDFIRNSSKIVEIKKLPEFSYEVIPLKLDNLSITGGNCFFYRKKDVENSGGYDQDVLMVRNLVRNGKKNVVILKNSTKHYSEESMLGLIKKFTLSKKAYYQEGQEKFDYLPRTKKERNTFLKNFLFNILIVPNFYYSSIVFNRSGDSASFFYPLMAFVSTISYGASFIKEIF